MKSATPSTAFLDVSRRTWTLTFLVAALLVRLLAAFIWQAQSISETNFFRLEDSHTYWHLAEQLAAGNPYQYGSPNASVFRTPLLPLLLAPLTLIPDMWSAVFAARCLGAVLGTISVALVSEMARRLAGTRAAILACGLAAFYPGAIGMSILILSEMLFIPLMLGQLLLWQISWDCPTNSRRTVYASASGVMAGLAVLTRPSWLLFIPLATLFGLTFGPRRGRHWQIGIASLLAMTVIMAPWWARNARITGKLVLTTLQVGPSLLDGLRSGATGASDQGMSFMAQVIRDQTQIDTASAEPLQGTFEWRVNRRAAMTAVQWSMENPTEAFLLSLKKFIRTWSLWPDGNDLTGNHVKLAITISFCVIFILSVIGTWQQFRVAGWMLAICWLPCLYFTLLHMVFVGSIRYREPGMMVLIALAGCSINHTLTMLMFRSEDPERVGP